MILHNSYVLVDFYLFAPYHLLSNKWCIMVCPYSLHLAFWSWWYVSRGRFNIKIHTSAAKWNVWFLVFVDQCCNFGCTFPFLFPSPIPKLDLRAENQLQPKGFSVTWFQPSNQLFANNVEELQFFPSSLWFMFQNRTGRLACLEHVEWLSWSGLVMNCRESRDSDFRTPCLTQ